MTDRLRIVISFPPGGATAFIADVLASALTDSTGRVVEVESHSGEFGTRALRELLKGPADEVLMVGSVNTNSIAPVLHREELSFDYSLSVVPVCRVAEYASVLVAPRAAPRVPLSEYLDYLKTTAGRIVYGTDFLGTNVDVDMVRLCGTRDVRLAYRVADGALAILDDLERGRIDMTVLNIGTMRREQGRYHALAAISSETRIDYLPDTPTMAEAGFPGIGVSHWLGVFASSETKGEALRSLHALIASVMSAGTVVEQIEKTGARVAVSESPQQFSREIEVEMEQWESLKPQILALQEAE